MAATALAVIAAPGFWNATGVAAAFVGADVINGNSIIATNDMLVVAFNSDVVARTVTVTSEPLDSFARSVDAVKSIAAGGYQFFRLTKNGWANSSNLILIAADHVAISFIVLDLKGSA